MIILLFIVVPMVLVAAYAVYGWLRTRQPTSVESGVDAFRREMDALSPDAAPSSRRPEPLDPLEPPAPERAPEPGPRPESRRPPGPTASPPPEGRRAPRRPGSTGPEAGG